MDCIEKMHLAWKGRWPKNMQFDQKVSWYKHGQVFKQSIWHEIISSPEKLHIRFDGFDTGNGVIFLDDHVYHFENGTLIKKAFKIHPALLLGFDVYHQAPCVTRTKLRALGIDLSTYYETKD